MGYRNSPKWSKLNYKNKISSKNQFNLIQKRFNSNLVTSNKNNYSNRLNDFLKENNLKPIYLYENLQLNETKNNILKDTKGLSGIYLILNKLTLDFYIGSASTNRFYARFSNHLIYFRGILWSKISLLCLKLSNFGDFLKLLILNYNWKILSGWTNHSGIVKSQNMIEREMENRGSKSKFISNFVKEQRLDGNWLLIKLINLIKSLKCILMGCESSYQVRVFSKQINKKLFNK